MTESKICTCPSGDGSLRWPCPKHPAVEQAGGDERAAFEVWIHTFDLPPQLDGEIFADERYPEADCFGQFVYDDHSTQRCWAAWQARAALAQPSPALPPFAEKVLAKLRRFYDCASDFESGGVDIGRHWLDLLTQLGLLNRVQRSPALWEISQQGEDLLGMPQPSPAQELAERGTQHRFSTTEQTCRHDFYGVWWNDSGVTKTGRECRHCGFFVADMTEAAAEQAEAERPEVFGLERYRVERTGQGFWPYCVRAGDGTRELFVGHLKQCKRVAAQLATAFEDGKFVAGALRAENTKLSEALDECDGDRWKLRSERDAANARLHEVATACATAEQQRDAALARVAELERQQPVAWMHDQPNRVDVIHRDVKDLLQRVPGSSRGIHRPLDVSEHYTIPLYAAPVAQAQHSVPGDIMRDAQRYRWLRDQQFYFSFSTENSDAGISSCTAGMSSRFKNLSWVDAAIDSAIAAAPGKEVGHE